MASELRTSENPRKWRYTWEALSHVPTLRLLLFNSSTNPKNQCENLKIDLNLQESVVRVSWFEDTQVSLRVPIPRVLVDVESPLSFRVLDDHIEVKLVLLLPVDHPIVSNFDSVFKLSDDECCTENSSQPLLMDSDIKGLSSRGGVHFYCRSCSTQLTRSPLSHFVEMPSTNWREVADNWFGACCCSFGGASEKLVNRYTNSYSCAEGTCLLNATSVILCKDDLLGWKFSDWDGSRANEFETYFVGDGDGDGDTIETTLESGSNHGRKVCCENKSEVMHEFDGKHSIMHPKKENLAANPQCEFNGKEIDGDCISCTFSVLDFSENLASAPACCVDTSCVVLNDDNVDCSHDTSDTCLKDQEHTKTIALPENQKSFLNGFLGNVFMVRSSNLSKDIDWIEFMCPQCSSFLGSYPRGNGHAPLDGGVRLFKCYISTSLPVGESGDMFRKYTLERMFTNQLLESAKDELSFRTVVRDLRTKSPVLQIVLLNPNSWCCSGCCWGTEGSIEPVSKIDLHPVIKVLFADCSNITKSQSRGNGYLVVLCSQSDKWKGADALEN
ncbi:hypothetical protein L1049_024209 [Liquidambar formosana]|uniref:Ubiquitin-conjugating enzyme E2C-binding protein n=1 Tax=Liquidambar formosana TaxID=63359 RepID=A0AAP0RUX6_LIQFO